jgi:tetratricopeptide (TPR) repeat protein/predicted Ser/Thr protein kinase
MSSTSTLPRNRERLRRSVFPTDLDLSFADAALAKGYLTLDRVQECRRDYERLRSEGKVVSIGSLLLQRGDLTVDQYLEILAGREAAAVPPAPRSPEDAPRFVLGKYRIVRELGRGGMGIVYEARDSLLQRRVALKVLKPEAPPSSRAIDRFRREATIGAKLQHPNIVRVQEFGAAHDSLGRQLHYLAMEYVDGRTLSRVIAEGASRDELLRILEDVGRAVASAHKTGVIHRDLKPANVIVEASGRPVLVDFGVSQAEDFGTRLTTSGVVLGTPAYMAPEQVRGEANRIDARTDVYALGAMLYETLSGLPPFPDETTPLLLQKILTVGPVPLRRRMDSVDPQLESIVLKSMATDPEDRYPSAREWVRDLARVRRGQLIEARPARKWGRPLAVAAALLVLAAAWIAVPRRAEELVLRDRALQTERLLARQIDDLVDEYWRDESDFGPLLRSDARVQGLREALQSDLEALSARAGEDPYARGLLAWLAGDAAGARRLLEEAEAWEALAMVEREQRRYDEAIQCSTRALDRDPDNLACLEGRAAARFLRAVELSNGGAPAEEEFAAAAADSAAALKQDRRALVRSGAVRLAWAFHRARSGRESDELFAESIRELDEAVAEGREPARARLWRGLARLLWGMSATIPPWSRSAGRDPGALAAAAIADFDALIDGPRAAESARIWRGAAFILQGIVQTARLVDPTDSYERALGDLGEAIRRDPTRDEAWVWRGVARRCWAIREFLGGRDPRMPYESAVDDFSEALRRNPQRADTWTQRGEARLLWARHVMRSRGEDPLPVLDEAIRDYDESLRLNPSQGLVWSSRGMARETIGRLQGARQEGGAEAWYAAALGDYEEAVRLLPGLAATLSKPMDACVDVLRPR